MAIKKAKKKIVKKKVVKKPAKAEPTTNADGIIRKRKYNKDMPGLLLDHMAEGLSLRSFCGAINIHHSTLYDWVEKHEAFKDAMEIGINKSLLKWEKLGIELANGGARGSAKVWEINMYNRFKDDWNRDHKEEAKESTDINVNVRYNPDADQ